MLVLKSKEKWWDDECARPLTLLKLESTTDIDQVQSTKKTRYKKSMYFNNVVWNTECIGLGFQFPKYRLFRCIKLCFYYIRPMCREVNETSYWLIEMNIKKTLLPSVSSSLVLNLVEKAVLHYARLYKRSTKQATDNFQRTQP